MSHKELKNILYAEDENDIRAIAQIALEDLGGFNVKYCTNGEEVIDAAPEFAADLLLFDVMMPGMDGPSALGEIRKLENYADVPAIFMTAKIQTAEVEHYKSLGVIEVIAKPFDPISLAETIKKAWADYHG